MTRADGSPGSAIHTAEARFTYLADGITSTSDGDGVRSNTWIHDGRGRLIGVTDAADQRQSMAYDRWGNQVLVTDRDGAVTAMSMTRRVG